MKRFSLKNLLRSIIPQIQEIDEDKVQEKVADEENIRPKKQSLFNRIFKPKATTKPTETKQTNLTPKVDNVSRETSTKVPVEQNPQSKYTRPIEIQPPQETNTDYPKIRVKDELKERLEEMYDRVTTESTPQPDINDSTRTAQDPYTNIYNGITELPDMVTTYRPRPVRFNDIVPYKQSFITMLDDMYANGDEAKVDAYLLSVQDELMEKINDIMWHISDSTELNNALTRIGQLLNYGFSLSVEQSQDIEKEFELKNLPLGVHDNSSLKAEEYL